MKYLLSFICIMSLAASADAQSFNDAVRYSFVYPQGSARFAGTGGSLSPLGVDYTTLHTNPAGIGWNRNNSFQITPGFTLTSTETTSLNESDTDGPLSETDVNFTLPSIGAIFAGTTRSINWSTLNFGLGVSRIADFNQTTNFSTRGGVSIIQALSESINNDFPEPFRADLLLDIPNALFEDDMGVFTDFDLPENEGGTIRRDGLIERSGSMSEFVFGFGGNFKEKFLWGASFGIPFMNFTESYTYDEIDDRGEITGFDNAGYDQELTASGTGFNVKLGLIYRPTDALRVSASVHSPTFWSIDEEYQTTLEYNFTDGGVAQGGTSLSDISVVTNNLMTPWRVNAGLGFLVGRSGFISVDADYANYAANAFSFDDFTMQSDAVNADIDAILGSSLGLRVGGELNLSPLQVRAGIGYRQLPFQEYINDEDGAILTYSAGLGYSFGKFFIDVAAQYSGYGTFQDVYQTAIIERPVVTTDRTRISGLITFGVRGFEFGF